MGGLGIWYMIDLILILAGAMKTKSNIEIVDRDKTIKVALIITAIYTFFNVIFFVVGFTLTAFIPTEYTDDSNNNQSQNSQTTDQK